jgi:glycosyltransferase involved in cell wall biosynthesis
MGSNWKDYLGSWKAPLFSVVERWAVRIGDHQAAVSQFTRERIQEASDITQEQMPVIPNGVPIGRLQSIRQEFRTPLGEGPAFVFAGRLHANKRLPLMLDALAHLELGRPRPWFRIIGDGPSRRDLQERVRELGLDEEVEFTGTLESTGEVWRHMAECDVAVQPSSREGFGMFPLEAMALGLPVIFWSSDGSAVGEIVRTGLEGMRVENQKPHAFRPCLEAVRSDYTRFSERAVERAARFDWKRITHLFEDLVA